MKNKIYYGLFLLPVLSAVLISGCKKPDYDVPPVIIPKFEIPAGSTVVSIAQFKARYKDTINYTKLDTIKGDTIVQGILISNDSTGNMYKYLVIQDTSGGLMINVDNSSLYLTYKPGQRLYIKCKGLVLGAYRNMLQLGVNNSGAVGRIADKYKGNYIFKDGYSSRANLPAPKVVSLVNDLRLPKDLCKLVKINNVAFVDSGQVYSVSTASTSRNLVDTTGVTLTMRNSNYSLFAGTLLPKGRGSVTGIFTVYLTTKQLVIRDLNDVAGFKNY